MGVTAVLSAKRGPKKAKGVPQQEAEKLEAFSYWFQQLSALMAKADLAPMHVLGASEQRKSQLWRNRLSAEGSSKLRNQ